MIRLSPSKINTFRQCPLKYKYQYIDRLGSLYEQPRPYLNLGISVHQTLEAFFMMPPGERSLDRLIQEYRRQWKRRGFSSREEEREYGTRGLNMLRRYFNNFPVDVSPYCTEKWLQIEKENCVLVGKVDRIDRMPNGKYEIIDYKTGLYVPSDEELADDLQLSIYWYLAGEALEVEIEKLSLHLLEHGICRETRRDRGFKDTIESLVRETAETITSTEEFAPTVNPFCSFCDFNIICPAFSPGKTDEEKMARTVQNLHSLNKTGKYISSLLEKERLCEEFCEHISESLDCMKTALFLHDPDNHCLTIAAARGLKSNRIANVIFHEDEGIAGTVFSSGKPLRLNSVRESKEFKHLREPAPGSEPEHSLLCVPVSLGDEKFGVVSVESRRLVNDFSPEDEVVLSTLAGQFAVAYRNAVYYEKVRDLAQQLQQKVDRLNGIYEVSRIINSADNLDDLDFLLSEALAAGFTVESPKLYLKNGSGAFSPAGEGLDVPFPESLLHELCDAEEPYFLPEEKTPVGPGPALLVPLRLQEELAGMLTARWKSPDEPDDEVERLLMVIASQLVSTSQFLALAKSKSDTDFQTRLRDNIEKFKQIDTPFEVILVWFRGLGRFYREQGLVGVESLWNGVESTLTEYLKHSEFLKMTPARAAVIAGGKSNQEIQEAIAKIDAIPLPGGLSLRSRVLRFPDDFENEWEFNLLADSLESE